MSRVNYHCSTLQKLCNFGINALSGEMRQLAADFVALPFNLYIQREFNELLRGIHTLFASFHGGFDRVSVRGGRCSRLLEIPAD